MTNYILEKTNKHYIELYEINKNSLKYFDEEFYIFNIEEDRYRRKDYKEPELVIYCDIGFKNKVIKSHGKKIILEIKTKDLDISNYVKTKFLHIEEKEYFDYDFDLVITKEQLSDFLSDNNYLLYYD